MYKIKIIIFVHFTVLSMYFSELVNKLKNFKENQKTIYLVTDQITNSTKKDMLFFILKQYFWYKIDSKTVLNNEILTP